MPTVLDNDRATIVHADCVELLGRLRENSIDAVVTDPPYGLEFMGKDWDSFTGAGMSTPGIGERTTAWPSFFGTNRSRCANCTRLVGQGGSPCVCPEPNPIMDTSRASGFQVFCETWARAVCRVLKPGGHLLAFGGTRTYHRMACAIEDAGFEIRDSLHWMYGTGFPKSLNLGDGRGTALKPGHEPIVMARKPLIGTVAANVQAFGTGALNIDACRLAAPDVVSVAFTAGAGARHVGIFNNGKTSAPEPRVTSATPAGRWPANVLLDEAAAAELDAQSGYRQAGASPPKKSLGSARVYGDAERSGVQKEREQLDGGGASRFFYVAKPGRKERDLGCNALAPRSAGEATDREDGSDGLASPRAGAGRTGGAKNFHPTVKPVELMRYLVRLVTPPGGVVLDPFLGSGTTGIAAVLENARFLGIEKSDEYLPIACARIQHALEE